MGGSLLIFRVILVQLIEFLQALIFVAFLQKIIILGRKRINLGPSACCFPPEAAEASKNYLHIAKPASDMVDPLLERHNRNICHYSERPAALSENDESTIINAQKTDSPINIYLFVRVV